MQIFDSQPTTGTCFQQSHAESVGISWGSTKESN